MPIRRRNNTNLIIATDLIWQFGRVTQYQQPFISTELIVYMQPLVYNSFYQASSES